MERYQSVDKTKCGRIKRSGRTFSLVGHTDGHCRWCGAAVTGRRKTWCSGECADEYMLLKSPGAMRRLVEARDKGICATCGMDTIAEVAARNNALRWVAHCNLSTGALTAAVAALTHGVPSNHMSQRWWRCGPLESGPAVNAISSLFQVDHIEELADGGSFGIDNLRTLCLPCHYAKTAESATVRRTKKSHARLKKDLKKKVKTLRKQGRDKDADMVAKAVHDLFDKET